MQRHTPYRAQSALILQKRIFFFIAAIAFWLCFLTAVTPVHADPSAAIEQPVQPIVGMATWHG